MKPGKEFELIVTALPPFAPEYLHGVISLRTNLPEMPVVTIIARGYRQPTITVVPRVISLPSPLADGFSRQILVHHGKGHPLKLTDLKVTGGKLKLSLREGRLGGPPYFIILTGPAGYEVPETGEQITFKTDDPSAPQLGLRVVASRRPQSRSLPAGDAGQ